MKINSEHLDELKRAKELLEHPSIAAQISNLLGKPVGKGLDLLPEKWRDKIDESVTKSLTIGLEVSIRSLNRTEYRQINDFKHRLAVAVTGAMGGFFGWGALAVELPLTTTLMLRTIADIARSEGEAISDVEGKLACMEVFAMGGGVDKDETGVTGYYAVRTALTKTLNEAALFIAERGLADESAPIIVKFISRIASRFGVTVSDKLAVQAMPVIGAAAGAAINTIFINHFQILARGHFIIRRLERIYGEEIIKEEILQMAGQKIAEPVLEDELEQEPTN